MEQVPEVANPIMNVKEVAAFMRVSVSWLYRHLDDVPHRQIGNLHFFHRGAIEQYLAGQLTNQSEDELTDEQRNALAKEFVSSKMAAA